MEIKDAYQVMKQDELLPSTDPQKLRLLATWFDKQQKKKAEWDSTEVQRDLRRIANKISRLESEKAAAYQKGRESALRQNKSGCCCKFDEDGATILELCKAHGDFVRQEKAALEAENEHLKSIYAGLEKAYQLARNAAAGLTNYCEESASSIRCEKELEQAEETYRGIKPTLARVKEG